MTTDIRMKEENRQMYNLLEPSAVPLRHRRRLLVTSLFLLGCALSLWPDLSGAHEYRVAGLKIEHPWSRATAPGVPVGVGYLVLVNESAKADELIGASSPLAAQVEIHVTREEGGMTRMRRVERVPLPPGTTVRFAPGGTHLMLTGLKRPLAAGEKVPLLLRFAGAGEQRVELEVESPDSEPGSGGHAHH